MNHFMKKMEVNQGTLGKAQSSKTDMTLSS